MTLLPEYRAQLYDAAERRARRPVIRVARSWPLVVSTAVVVGLVVAAVAVLSHRQPSNPPAHSGPASVARQLEDVLGVFRRPQTRADLQAPMPGFLRISSNPGCRGANSARWVCTQQVVRPLIRSVAVPGSGYTVGLFPVTARPPASAGPIILGVAATLHGPGIVLSATDPPRFGGASAPGGLAEIRKEGLILSAYVSDGINRGAILVPDGVSRVVVGPVHLLDTTVTSRFTPTSGASAVVHDNVALFQLNGLSVKNLQLNSHRLGRYFSRGSSPGGGCPINFVVYALPATATVTWFAPDGRLANHIRINFPVYVGRHLATANPNCAVSR